MADSAAYGGFWIRSLAYAADLSILTLALLLLAIPFAFMGGAGAALYSLIATLAPVAYFTWLTASERRTTFGKQLCGLKVQHAASGERLSLLRSLARELSKFISAAVFFIGFLLAGLTQRKQGLHDMLASTVVVRDGQPRIVLAMLVALAGVVIPVIVIPLMFGAMFAGLLMMLMGGMMGAPELKGAKPVPQMEQKVIPRQPSPAPAKPAAAEPAKPAAAEPPKPAAAEPPKPVAPTAPAASPAPPAAAAQPKAAPRRIEPADARPAAPVLQQSRPACVYKPVMTDEEIARCR